MDNNYQQQFIDTIRSPWNWSVLLVLSLAVAMVYAFDANLALFHLFNGLSLYTGSWLWANLTTFGDSLVVFSLALLLVERRPQLLWVLMFSAIISTLIVHGLKEWTLVMRPPGTLAPDELIVIGTPHRAVSFPSGHTTAAFSLVALLVLQRTLATHWKVALLAAAAVVGISRMAVGVHWPYDVLGGALIGWSSVLIAYYFAPRIAWGVSDSAQRFFTVLLLFAAVSLLFYHDSGYTQARWLEMVIGAACIAASFRNVRTLFARKSVVEVEQDEEIGEKTEKRSPWGALIRIVVTLLILGLIFREIEFEKVLENVKDIVPRLLLLGIVFQLLSTTLAAYRWYLVMRPLGYVHDFGFYLRSYFKGAFFNQGLPTSIGGDAIRVVDVARQGCRKRDAFYGVFIDRVLGLVGLLILNLAANALNPDLLPQGVFLTINLLVACGVLGFVVLLLLRRLEWLKRWRITRLFHTISVNLSQVLVTPRDYFVQIGLSVAVHFLSLLAIFLIGRSIEMPFDLLTFLIVVPPVLLLTLVPVSLAGWGVREKAMIVLFTMIGADKVSALTMSILYGLVLVIASLPGLQVYLKGKHNI